MKTKDAKRIHVLTIVGIVYTLRSVIQDTSKSDVSRLEENTQTYPNLEGCNLSEQAKSSKVSTRLFDTRNVFKGKRK